MDKLKNNEIVSTDVESKDNNITVSFGNLYEANKKLVEANEKPLSKTAIRESKTKLLNFLNSTNNYYYMLLCHEKRDYTIFKTNKTLDGNKYNIDVLVDEIACSRGIIKGIDVLDDSMAVEFWISHDNESFVYMFFPCDSCVIDEV